jgi:hypothetical protein
MRGRPLLRIILVCLGVALMGIPVFKLTTAAVPTEATPTPVTSTTQTLSLALTFAHPPESFAVTYLGNPILAGKGPATAFTGPWPIALSKDGADLLLQAKWPTGTPQTAVEIKISGAGDVPIERTFWGTGRLTEIVTVLPDKP